MSTSPRDLAAQLDQLEAVCGAGNCDQPATHMLTVDCPSHRRRMEVLCGDHAGPAARIAAASQAVCGGFLVVESLRQQGDQQ